MKEDFESARIRVEAAGNIEAIGVLLRNLRSNLPDPAELRRNIRLRSETFGRIQLKKLEYDEKRRALADLESVIVSTLNASAPNVAGEARENLASLLRQTYETQRNTLDLLIEDFDKYDGALVKLDLEERSLLDATREFDTFVDEHILWIRSGTSIGLTHIQNALPSLIWPVTPQNLIQPLQALLERLHACAHAVKRHLHSSVDPLVVRTLHSESHSRAWRSRRQAALHGHQTNFLGIGARVYALAWIAFTSGRRRVAPLRFALFERFRSCIWTGPDCGGHRTLDAAPTSVGDAVRRFG